MTFPVATSSAANKHSVRTERWRYSTFPDGEELYDHWHDPNEWENLALKPEFAETKKELAALLPQKPSRKKIAQWSDLTAEQKNIVTLPPGLYHGSAANNDVGLPPGPHMR